MLGTQVVEQGSRPSLLQQQRLGLHPQVEDLHPTEPENDGESGQTESGVASGAHPVTDKPAPPPRTSLIARKRSAQDYERHYLPFTVDATQIETLQILGRAEWQ